MDSQSHTCIPATRKRIIDLHAKTDDIVKPKNISDSALERFEALKKRSEAVTKRSTDKRIKYLKQNVLDKVRQELTHDEDKDILREHDVKFGPPVRGSDITHEQKEREEEQGIHDEKPWEEVKQYFDINKHLEQSTPSTSSPQSGLEVKVNDAIKRGDIHTAEVLSDKLAARDFGAKISNAVAARDFLKRKKEEATKANEKKKRKLNWGFEHKQRWETKSNM